jgi:hypothetical protein
MTIFQKADESRKRETTANYSLRLAVDNWKMPQRQLLDAFASAWVTRARAVASDRKRDGLSLPNRRALAIEATRSFARVNALREEGDTTALMMVSSAFATSMYESIAKRTLSKEAVAAHADERARASQFKDQEGLEPYSVNRSAERTRAGWASRRIDVEVQREWGIDPEISPDTVSETLWIEPMGTKKHYYSPMGSRIEGLPGRVPWGIKDLGSRIVWVSALLTAVQRLRRSAVKYTPTYDLGWRTVRAIPVPPVGQGQGGLRGLARHPLTVTADANDTDVAVSDAKYYARKIHSVDKNMDTLLNALDAFSTTREAGNHVQKRSEASRAAAFNADRLLAGIELALIRKHPDAELHVILPGADYIPAFVLAMAMNYIERGGIFTSMSVHVPTAEGAEQSEAHLVRIENACSRAEAMGCKVVALSEACASLA